MWLIFEPQIRSTRFAMKYLFNIATTESKVHFCVKLLDHFPTEYLSFWAEICRISSQTLLRFFHKISTRNCFWKILLKYFGVQGPPLSIYAKFCPSFSNFILSSYYADKFRNHLDKYFHMSLYPVKEAHPKRKHRKRYKEEKHWRSIFEKTRFPVLFALRLRIITPYALGVLIWSFYQTFIIVCIELWLRFEPQNCSTRFAMYFLFIIATTEWNVRFYVKLFDHFQTEFLSVWAEICFLSSQILLGFFPKISTRIFWENVPETSWSPRCSFFHICKILPLFLQFYYEFILRW